MPNSDTRAPEEYDTIVAAIRSDLEDKSYLESILLADPQVELSNLVSVLTL